jgi:hypothetical protein
MKKARRDNELLEKGLQLRRHLGVTDMSVVETTARMRFQRYARGYLMLVKTISQAARGEQRCRCRAFTRRERKKLEGQSGGHYYLWCF